MKKKNPLREYASTLLISVKSPVEIKKLSEEVLTQHTCLNFEKYLHCYILHKQNLTPCVCIGDKLSAHDECIEIMPAVDKRGNACISVTTPTARYDRQQWPQTLADRFRYSRTVATFTQLDAIIKAWVDYRAHMLALECDQLKATEAAKTALQDMYMNFI